MGIWHLECLPSKAECLVRIQCFYLTQLCASSPVEGAPRSTWVPATQMHTQIEFPAPWVFLPHLWFSVCHHLGLEPKRISVSVFLLWNKNGKLWQITWWKVVESFSSRMLLRLLCKVWVYDESVCLIGILRKAIILNQVWEQLSLKYELFKYMKLSACKFDAETFHSLNSTFLQFWLVKCF